ncbi:unnamed protein product [Cladocopium goreaui]|uniref:Uncharacterized protein n=1 Tax=Cladocopium goreaui TaxID=2562237 RepID=A0A9P1FFQ8_9DINO|nr:unnamed protein product [Cladocopium goreaui]
MDQLELRITGAHIRLEGCQGNQLKATAGLIFDSFSIHPAVSEGGLRQRVEMTLSAYAYYADPEVQLADVPPEAFVVSNASPSCWATRISGRRFVDWKGLQLQLEGQHMQVQWRREQLRCCLQLAQQAKGERIKSDDFADAREEDEFLECEDVAVQSWSRWLRDKWRGPPNSELGEELPEGVSESDRAILLEDGAGNGLAGADAAREKLEVSLMLPKVTLLAMDSSLQFSAGFMLQLDIVELDDWNFHGELLEFGVLELSKSADQLSVVRFEGADVPATLTITRREAKGELKLCLDRLRLHLRPALQRGVAWLTTLRPQDVADVADPAVLWRMELEMLQLAVVVGGEPWHYGPVVLESTGIKGSWEEAVGTLQQVVTLKLDAKEDILQPTALTATCGASLPLKLRAEPRMECHCDVEDLVSMVRSAKCLINYFSAHLESTDVSGWRGALEFECPELELKVRDLEVGFQKEVRVTTLKASYDGFSELNSWSASCEHCDMQVQLLEGVASVEVSLLRASGQGGTRMDGSLQSLRCQDPSHEEPALSCDAASGSVELAEKCHVTLRCPKMEVNTTESFLLRCKIAVDYILDFLETLVFIEPVLLEERPFGFCAQDTKIVDSSEDAVRLGLRCGWRLCGLQPPAEALLLELQQRQVPLTLLLMPEEEVRVFHMTVDAISLRATQISLERGGLQAKIAEADLHFDPLLLDCQGTWAELLERLKANYTRKITQALPKLFCNVFLAGRNLRDAAFCSASSSLAMLRFGGVATGAVASSVAEGVAQAFKASVQKGQELRRGSDEEASDGYRFGDLTRGLLSLARERGQRVMGTYDDRGGGGTGSDVTAVAAGSVAGAASFAYESAVVSSTLGATIGGTMLAPLGPAGVGSTAARRVSERMGQATLALREVISNTVEEGKESRSDPSGAYRFGDFTRGVLRAGREQREASGTSGAPGGAASSGGEADGTAANTSYRPGDFTRGLWSKLRK